MPLKGQGVESLVPMLGDGRILLGGRAYWGRVLEGNIETLEPQPFSLSLSLLPSCCGAVR
jgi:hypothetical protein